MMEKQKNNQPYHKWRLLSCLVLFYSFLTLCLSLSIIGRILKTSLDSESIPTAEALLNSPASVTINSEISIELKVRENFSSIYEWICVQISPVENYERFQEHSELYIDEARVIASNRQSSLIDGLAYLASDSWSWCATGELQPGIHLIEFHLKDSFWGEPIHIQQWAIEID